MTITASISIEPQHDDINIIDGLEIIDDAGIVGDSVSAAVTQSLADRSEREPLLPFLCLGVLSWIGIVITATLLAF